jgi:hypothetical protein
MKFGKARRISNFWSPSERFGFAIGIRDLRAMQLHIGNIIATALKSSGLSASEFAKRIGQHRQNVRDILGRETMDTGLLLRISVVLEQDFFEAYSEALGSAPQADPVTAPDVPAQVAQLQADLARNQAELAAAQREIGYLQEIVALLRGRQT